MFGSSMPLVRWLTGKVYLVLGVRYLSLHQILADSNHSTMCNTKGPVCKGDVFTLLESRWDARRLK